MEQHPAVTMNGLAVLSTRYHEIQLRLLELSTEKVERRFVEALVAQAPLKLSAKPFYIGLPDAM